MVFLDWNSTLGPPKTKDRLLHAAGVPAADFNAAFDADWRKRSAFMDADASGRIKRAEKIKFLIRWMDACGVPPLTLSQLHEFGATEHVYPGVKDALTELRDGIRAERGVDVVYAVCTNAWADVVGKTELFKEEPPLIAQLYGQQLRFDEEG